MAPNLNDPVLASRVAEYNRKIEKKQKPWYLLWFVLLLALLLAYATYDGNRGANRFQVTQENGEQIAEVVTRLAVVESLLDAQVTQFEACVNQDTAARPDCAEPISPPSEAVEPDTEAKPPSLLQPLAPTQAQTKAAVTAFCTETGECAGQVPTPEQVAAAVTGYCSANGECRGPAGQSVTGGFGPQGESGPPPTDAQVLAAVTAYCATGACTGPAGPEGPAGPICPEGWNPAELLVLTAGLPVNIYTCVAAGTTPPDAEVTP